MRRFLIVLVSLFFIVVLVSTNEILNQDQEENIEFREAVSDYIYKSNIENNCLTFINTKLCDEEGGIYTNYLESNEVGELAQGHQVLSESLGLIMLYYSRNDVQEGFQKHYEYLTNKMLLSNHLTRWRYIGPDEDVTITSTIDDLRIIRGLLYGYTRWDDSKYLDLAKKTSNSLLLNLVVENSLVDYFDVKTKEKSEIITMAYLDLYTMKFLTEFDSRWKNLMDGSMELINSGYIDDSFPFYKEKYDVELKAYVNKVDFNMTEGLVTILHLAENNQVKKETIDWIKDRIKNDNKIYTHYNLNGERISEYESTAIYSLICRIGKQINDEELYNLGFERMDDFYVKDKDSPIYGAFGDENTLEVFSFDNLQGLLAF